MAKKFITKKSQPTLSPLNNREIKELEKHKGIVDRGIGTYFKVGRSLMVIRDNLLYRDSYETFEAFCQAEFSLPRQRAYELIRAAKVAKNVGNLLQTPPAVESHAAPLAKLPLKEQASAWQEAQRLAGDTKVTAQHVKSVVNKRLQVNDVAAKPKSAKKVQADEKPFVAADDELEHGSPLDRARSATEPVRQMLDQARQIQNSLKEHAGTPAAVWLDIDQVKSDIENLISTLEAALPDERCARCDGGDGDCEHCRGLGAVPQNKQGQRQFANATAQS